MTDIWKSADFLFVWYHFSIWSTKFFVYLENLVHFLMEF